MKPTHGEVLARFDRSFAVVDTIVDTTPEHVWSMLSPCDGWTARDVLNHLTWGQALVDAWSHGGPAPDPTAEDWTEGALPAELPNVWKRRRNAARAGLTASALDRQVVSRAFGELPLWQFVWTFPGDALLHAWDLATTAGSTVDIPDDLAAAFLDWAEHNEPMLRRPGGLGPALPAPPEADAVTRWLAFAGRAA